MRKKKEAAKPKGKEAPRAKGRPRGNLLPRATTSVAVVEITGTERAKAKAAEVLVLVKEFTAHEKEEVKIQKELDTVFQSKVNVAAKVGKILADYHGSLRTQANGKSVWLPGGKDEWAEFLRATASKGLEDTRRNDWMRIGRLWTEIQANETFKKHPTIPTALIAAKEIEPRRLANPRRPKPPKETPEQKAEALAKQILAAANKGKTEIEDEDEDEDEGVRGKGMLHEVGGTLTALISEEFMKKWKSGKYKIRGFLDLYEGSGKPTASLEQCELADFWPSDES